MLQDEEGVKDEGNQKGEEVVLKIPCFFGNVSDWLLLLTEGKDNGKGESVATYLYTAMDAMHCICTCTHMDKKKEGSVLAEIVYA